MQLNFNGRVGLEILLCGEFGVPGYDVGAVDVLDGVVQREAERLCGVVGAGWEAGAGGVGFGGLRAGGGR